MPRMPKNDTKPGKPYPDYPLYAHATGRWAKKIRGKIHYFGPWRDPDGALELYQAQKEDLYLGRTPVDPGDRCSIAEACDLFLNHHKKRLASGEISQRTFRDLHDTSKRVVRVLGKSTPVELLQPTDFAKLRTDITKTRGNVATANEMQRARSIFLYAYDEGLIDRPVRYGQSFKRPPKRTIRIERNQQGEKMFEAEEIRLLLSKARYPLRAMILLGINCGFGNSDVANLPMTALQMSGTKNWWCSYPRPKTGIRRRVPLWPETVGALRMAKRKRPTPKSKDNRQLLFITKYGLSFAKHTGDNPISKEMTKLLKEIGIRRKNVSFYALRHTFETIAGDTKDQIAVDAIMGHAKDDMASVYRQKIFEQRLRDVVNHVRDWLFELSEEPSEHEAVVR